MFKLWRSDMQQNFLTLEFSIIWLPTHPDSTLYFINSQVVIGWLNSDYVELTFYLTFFICRIINLISAYIPFLRLQVRTLFLQWLPWLLRMNRPGKPITRKSILMNNRMNEIEMKKNSSKSLLANVLDMDDDFRWEGEKRKKRGVLTEISRD